jgi:GNAT superfamily N-acetyltransferase
MAPEIAVVETADQLQRLLPLMRAYCDFYNVSPNDAALVTLSRALIADPQREGRQLLATEAGQDIGFATLFWSWETGIAGRVGVMNDLFVVDSARGHGVGAALIAACRAQCRGVGALRLVWQTAADNRRAQSLYSRVGAVRENWLDYWIAASEP